MTDEGSDLPEAERPAGLDSGKDEAFEPPTGYELMRPESPFAHPAWALPMVLVLAVPFLIWGLLGHPIWLLIGSPFILVLLLWIWVRRVEAQRASTTSIDAEDRSDA
ncbi:MAG: hypothetical protein GKS06_10430 [Acidobacteria bacterium]|nr:hypothetical protein [Acidobacteriota bacterium]